MAIDMGVSYALRLTMTYAEVVKYFGSQAAAARELKLSAPTVWAWQHETIPYDRQCQIEIESSGALKASRKHDSRKKVA